MPCPKMEAGKECEDCSEVNDKPDAWKICDKRVSDFYEEQQAEAEYLAEQQEEDNRLQFEAEQEAKARDESEENYIY